ncbi:GNAT family N-acetyltransferase [Anoxybacteroides tepidamans]|uniref:GNAT family N-acetyltransferase n=1 Tax=Anoxybacteroides tepidamans TaxID=265948 RepID=UPI00048813EE|nr:GNAT family N-acetyltransferase [Anoxybacillus tepidamans]
MSERFQIRKATIQDIHEMIALRLQLLKELREVQTQEEEEAVAASTRTYLESTLNSDFISYLAVCNNSIVSISRMVLFQRPPYIKNLEGREAYVLNMYTVPEYRGRGLAKKLLENCIKECQNIGVKRVWLHASAKGMPLYKKMGFTFKNNEMELFI